MRLRLLTFNIENLVTRHRFQPGGRPDTSAAMSLFDFRNPAERDAAEKTLHVSLEDDKRQMTALALAESRADLVLLQEVDSLASLQAFFANYVHRVADHRYGHFAVMDGNDTRGIDVAFAARRDLFGGADIRLTSHAAATFADLDVHDDDLGRLGIAPNRTVFHRDALMVDLVIRGRPLTLIGCHFKSMNNGRDDGRDATLPLRRAEARAVRRIIERKFGPEWRHRNWIVAGDLNGYSQSIGPLGRIDDEGESGLEPLTDGFGVDIWQHVQPHERWSHFRRAWSETRERLIETHMPLDHIILSPALAAANPSPRVDLIRAGLPYRVPLDPRDPDRSIATLSAAGGRYPRIGWDRPKASDHCPLILEFNLPHDKD
jgi:endonuclease/exonuclease/phosphatase family metal-dependent hydrolase